MTAKDNKPSTLAVEEFTGRIFPLGEITHKKMFGGYGVFEDGTMFSLITSEGVIHLKADESNRGKFEETGAQKHARMPYYQIPEQVLENDTELLAWTQEAIAVSKKAKK
ncbi:MAG: TfoX/Sxy family protein [Anaerolineales bacterium]|uniref:TfoX/Sxy family protein n=1 Tax=Candidatus Desulfolinea nitratireducens TaxID=2841698 RepID=A0A8J6THW6_9CHLR|nr:TfoX/Sxy family protein [Candidatus Desulfolinea nitratireducens]MBL6961091.1 TfoX/Sxy family protein [Anaerolineales bacterium]